VDSVTSSRLGDSKPNHRHAKKISTQTKTLIKTRLFIDSAHYHNYLTKPNSSK